MKKTFVEKIIYKSINYSIGESPAVIEVILPNGFKVFNHKGKVDLQIKIKRWFSFMPMFFLHSYGFATEYICQRIDVKGDLRWLGYLTYHYQQESHLDQEIKNKIHDRPLLVRIMNALHMVDHRADTKKRVRYNAEFHYGHEPEFYFNYLGPTGAYSTGFWYKDTKNIEEAQQNKWEMILKKLHLQPGMKVCSVGSGFGYGEILAAEKYGVHVDCFNICRPQNKWLREEIQLRGLDDKIKVFDIEYRNLNGEQYKNKYDRLLVIECIEHAQDNFRMETFRGFKNCLKEEGIGIMQWLSYDINSDVSLFIREFLYPGVTMPPLGQMLNELALSDFEILDLICNRRHYYYTLNAWYENLISNWKNIQNINPEKYNEKFKRIWSLYLASGSFYLVTPDAPARLYQATFSKGNTHTYPMNREFIYNKDSDFSDKAWVQPHPWAIK